MNDREVRRVAEANKPAVVGAAIASRDFDASLQRVASQLGASTDEERDLLDSVYHDDCG